MNEIDRDRLADVKRVKHWNRDFAVGQIVWSERHMALGKIDRIFLHSIDRDHYAIVSYDRTVGGHQLNAADPLNTLRHATQVEIAVNEAKKALEL